MSYARPKLGTAEANKIRLEIPKGWSGTITSDSRRTYKQLALIKLDTRYSDTVPFSLSLKNIYLTSTWNSPNGEMYDVDTGAGQFSFVPQDREMSMDFIFYYSKIRSESEDAQNPSTKFQPFISNKPDGAPAEMADYMTIRLVVQDSPDAVQVAGQPQVEDLVLTINLVSSVVFSPPAETGTRGQTEQGKQAIGDFLSRYLRPGQPYPGPPPPYEPTPELAKLVVGIIGAGVSGLYIGMMLDSLGIAYEIVEGSGRIGGRLYTHQFPKNQGKYQYYDVGAMRYPETTFMKRTFDLVRNQLNMPTAFIPYIRANEKSFFCFNDITITREIDAKTPKANDVFKVSHENGGNIPQDYVAKGSGAMWNEGLKELRDNFKEKEFMDAYNALMSYDGYSVSGYLQQVKGYPIDVINWFQTSESRTGLMDEALTETVLASLVFNDPKSEGKGINWYCLDGGSEIVHVAMTERLSSKPVLYQRATVIEESDDGNSITVTLDGRKNPNPSAQTVRKRKYSNVINTMSFACLRMVDLRNAGLNYGQRNAIRDLMYTPSVKVGMQFKSAWWERLGIVGGQSSTDLPIRDVVYPSYGPDDSHKAKGQRSNCMIVSYNGMQDSQRLGGLMHGRFTHEEDVLVELIMRNLAQLHNVDEQMLWGEFEDYHAWDFCRDSFQLGAFCQFGPGQFNHVYPYVQQPAGSKQRIHFAGDATSSFHGWVAGALNSGWRAVMGMLISHPELNPNKDEDIIEKFQKLWGKSEELDNETLATVVNLGRDMPKVNAGSSL
ncbi:L-amino acid oxidase [Mycena latifolia]|nr:L-amino acid oxidase [Mycena latifolia]